MNEQAELMRETVKEFADKNLKDLALKVEREGIPDIIKEKIIEQGFLGSTLKSEFGGAGLDPLSHRLILFELAKVSPSVAAYVFFHNDIVLKLLSDKGKKEQIKAVIGGKDSYAISISRLTDDSAENKDNEVLKRALNSKSNRYLDLSENGVVFSGTGTAQKINDFKPLGLRGMGVCDFRPSDREEVGKKEDLESILVSSSGDISAIFLGITEGALDKAIEYTKVRKTFNEPLKNYEPVAFRIAEIKSELEMLKFALFAEDCDEIRLLMLKDLSASLARKATKYALQFHGGYGYLEDFGVEKYYRDSVALNAIIYRPIEDKKFLATKIYDGKSGYI